MSYAAVRCPRCDAESRVPADAIGRAVACPRCDVPFTALPEALPDDPEAIPLVYPARWSAAPAHGDASPPPGGVLLGLALLPLAIPLVWLLGPLLTGKEAVFTLAVPAAVAVGAVGLSLGVVWAADWSFATRVKGIAAIILIAYGVAGFLYFLQPAWVESLRRQFGGDVRWQAFDRLSYIARMPGKPEPTDDRMLAGWDVVTFKAADTQWRPPVVYTVASGMAPDAVLGKPDDAFFAAAKAAAEAAADGRPAAETAATKQGRPARQFVIRLADATTRTLLVVRDGRRVFVATAEGAFLPPDARDVKEFFSRFLLKDDR